MSPASKTLGVTPNSCETLAKSTGCRFLKSVHSKRNLASGFSHTTRTICSTAQNTDSVPSRPLPVGFASENCWQGNPPVTRSNPIFLILARPCGEAQYQMSCGTNCLDPGARA